MTKIALAKNVAAIVVGMSTSFVVGNIVRNNVTPASKLQKIEVEVGAFVLGYMVAGYAQEYIDREIDKAAAWWKKNVTPKFAK